jgi:hypothetical protein
MLRRFERTKNEVPHERTWRMETKDKRVAAMVCRTEDASNGGKILEETGQIPQKAVGKVRRAGNPRRLNGVLFRGDVNLKNVLLLRNLRLRSIFSIDWRKVHSRGNER